MPPEMICRACGKTIVQKYRTRIMTTCDNKCRLIANKGSLARFMRMPEGKYEPRKKA
jgi:hypothetical protein